ncbi:MAG: DUF4340 domain-containing protein [Verrucomicrobia bacterium]|nr:DUF4340 domain-containing protein [Verrucomicrobiota bacterium]
MRTKVTLVLVFLNVALFFFIFKFERQWITDGRQLEARRRVLGPEVSDVRWLEVTNPANNAASFTLTRQGDAWSLLRPVEWPANPHAVATILSDLRLLEHESSFNARDLAKSGQSLADYGLDKPRLKLEFRAGTATEAPTTKLELGDITKVGNRLYVRTVADDRIHVVGRALADSLALPLSQLRSDTLLTIPVFEARSLSVRSGTGAPVRLRRESDNTRWTFETPIIARASKAEVDLTINALNALHAANFNPATPPAALPAAAPSLRVSLEGNNRRETLLLGEPIGATAIPNSAATSPDVELYAQLEGRSALFTVAVPTRLLEKLRDAQDRLRERRVLDFDATKVTAVALNAPNQPPLTLQRDPAAPPDSPWQVVRRTENPTAPLQADPAAVKRLLAQLAALAATKFESDAPSAAQLENWGFNRPERVVALTLAGTATPLELQLGTDARRDAYARLSASANSIYAVNADILRELPVEPRAWRDRLVRELPAAARITALKLTDLEGGAVLLDAALDAQGAVKPATLDARLVGEIVARLRSLRARRFVQDAFADRFLFAGEERTWRYRLDTTESLPGGAGGEQTKVTTLLLSIRGGGGQQLAGVKEADALFEIEQPLLDALWKLSPAGQRDPGATK